MASPEQLERERAHQPNIVHIDKVSFLKSESVILANTGKFLSIGIIEFDENSSLIMIRGNTESDSGGSRKIFIITPTEETDTEELATNTAREMLGISIFDPLDIFSYKCMDKNYNPRFTKLDNKQINPQEYNFYRWYWHKICQVGISIPFSYFMYKDSRR